MSKRIEISHRTIIFTVAFLGLVWVLIQIIPIIIGLFIALLLSTALNPIVGKLVRFKVPRGFAILFIYIILLGVLIWGLATIISPLVEQTTSLGNRLPLYFSNLGIILNDLGIPGIDNRLIAQQFSTIGTLPANIVEFLLKMFSNVIAVVTILVITYYLLLERKNLDSYILTFFGLDGQQKAHDFIDKLEFRLGGWVRGEIILMAVVGAMIYVGLLLLGIPYALPLAILAGLFEILPNIGPVISAIPGILVGFTVSPVMALATAALYFLVQQVENSIIVPKVMQKAAGVNPLITIISLAIGFQLGGAFGAILAVPVVILLHVTGAEIFNFETLRKMRNKEQ